MLFNWVAILVIHCGIINHSKAEWIISLSSGQFFCWTCQWLQSSDSRTGLEESQWPRACSCASYQLGALVISSIWLLILQWARWVSAWWCEGGSRSCSASHGLGSGTPTHPLSHHILLVKVSHKTSPNSREFVPPLDGKSTMSQCKGVGYKEAQFTGDYNSNNIPWWPR